MSGIIERAEVSLDLWNKTYCVEIEVLDGMVDAVTAYRNAPDLVRDLVAELKAITAERDKLSELLGGIRAEVRVVPEPSDFELPWA